VAGFRLDKARAKLRRAQTPADLSIKCRRLPLMEASWLGRMRMVLQ